MLWSQRAEINWDEFVLLARAADSLRDGQLHGGGRPGLATLVLVPLVRECVDTVSAVRVARLWWAPFSVGILVGLWFTLRSLFAGRVHAHLHALAGLALVVLTPNFLRYVVQVRSDQPAIAFGLIAGALLIHPRRSCTLAMLAGLFFGVGYLFSQKLVYVGALVCLLALGDLLIRRQIQIRREALRVLAVLLPFLTVLAVFRVLVALTWAPPAVTDLAGQMDVFQWYRDGIGYRYYVKMLPGLIGPIALMIVTLITLGSALTRRGESRNTGLLSLAVLALGVAVGLFHAGAFPYFWMTLGLFPGVALAIGLPVLSVIPRWGRLTLFSAVSVVMVLTAIAVGGFQSRDGQAVQRSTMQFLATNISPEFEGFHTTRALFCRDGPRPLPTYLGQNIAGAFQGDDSTEAAADLMAEFRDRPIAYLVHSFRMAEFPESVRQFWADHYVPYFSAVHLHGIRIANGDSEVIAFDALVSGYYTFLGESPGLAVRVNGEPLGSGERVWLEPGIQEIRLSEGGVSGLFVFWVPAEPRSGSGADTFYSRF